MKFLNKSIAFFVGLCFISCHRNDPPTHLLPGLKITQSTIINPDTFRLSANGEKAAVTIEGENLTVDFNGAVLVGSENMERPDLFSGTGVYISGKNITVKNAVVRGFKTALFAEGTDSLKLIDCDFSYNYRCNKKNKKCGDGMAVKLIDCDNATIKGAKISGVQNGIYVEECEAGIFYNNKIEYNPGAAFVFKNAHKNKVAHNRINWNNGGAVKLNGEGNMFSQNSMTHNNGVAICLENKNKDICTNNYFSKNDCSHSFNSPEDSLLFFHNYIFGKSFGPLPGALPTALAPGQLKGRQYILTDEWGPYNFEYPSIWLRNVEGDKYTFLLLGPPTGNYKIIDGEGWSKLNRVSGAFPATLIATAKPGAEKLSLELEFIGQAFVDGFGQFNKKGKVFPFRYRSPHL